MYYLLTDEDNQIKHCSESLEEIMQSLDKETYMQFVDIETEPPQRDWSEGESLFHMVMGKMTYKQPRSATTPLTAEQKLVIESFGFTPRD